MKRTTFAFALVLAVVANTGCTSREQTASTGIAVSGELGDAGIAACDHYYAAHYTRCGGPTLPASENARLLVRFRQVCENEAALPGSGVTAASLEACASALDLSPCELPEGPPVACNFHGSLAGDSACTDGLQCQSGMCSGTVSYNPGGQSAPFTCGTCEPLAVVGEACGSAGCPAMAGCITATPNAAQANYTCVAIEQGEAGARCDGLSKACKPGLYCAGSRTCEKLAALGAACGDLSDPGGCVAPLGCGPTSICVSGNASGPCLDDTQCAPGLGCNPSGPCSNPARFGCSASGACMPITWAGAGQTCSDSVRCLVGACDFGDGLGPPISQGPDGGLLFGTCPTVVPDGQPCVVSSTCDTFAECFNGTCSLLDAVVCK